jgi:hypothetical protein
VYNTRSWAKCSEEDEHIMYTRSVGQDGGDVLYVFLTEWKNNITLSCPEPTASTKVRMLGLKEGVEQPKVAENNSPSSLEKETMTIHLPALPPNLVPCQYIWTIAIEGVGNLGPGPISGGARTDEAGATTSLRMP